MLRYKLAEVIVFIRDVAAVGGLDRGDIARVVVGIRDGFALVDKVLDAGMSLVGGVILRRGGLGDHRLKMHYASENQYCNSHGAQHLSDNKQF